MILKQQLKTGSWYKGFHPQFHVAKWTGTTFASIDGKAVAYYCDHSEDFHDGFEPTEEIEAPPERLKNENQVQIEVDNMVKRANGLLDGLS